MNAALRPAAMSALRGAAALLAAGVLWEALVVLAGIRPDYLPRLSDILALIATVPEPYVEGFLRTASETVLGFALGAVVGVVNGVLFKQSRLLRELVFPLFVISQTIPDRSEYPPGECAP